MPHESATRLALIAFAAAGAQGLLAWGDFEGTIRTALWAAAAFYGLGYVVGELGRRLAEESAAAEFVRVIAEQERQAKEAARAA